VRELPDELPPTFTAKTARMSGVHPRDLYGWRDGGLVVELSRGVFRRNDAPLASYPDLLAVSLRAPLSVVCCLSAAVVHDLTDELVAGVQIAVPAGAWPPQIDHPPTTVFRFEPATFELGVTSIQAAPNESVRIYDPARAVVDLMRLRRRFGEPLAHIALNRYLAGPGANAGLLLEYAESLGVLGPVRAAVDVVSAR
jgi:hypothetical protein